MSSFTTPLDVEYLDGRVWKLTAAFEYHVGVEGSEEVIVVPAGYVTDFASIPRIFWNILPPTGQYGKAAVIHDYLYSVGSGNRYSRVQADEIFREAMQILGVGTIRRTLMFRAVRLFGWKAFKVRKTTS